MTPERDCTCDCYNIYLYIAWKHEISRQVTDIIAICRTQEKADDYAKYSRDSDTRTWVERVLSDHAFASTMYGRRR